MNEVVFKLGTSSTASLLNYVILAFVGVAILLAIFKGKKKQKKLAVIFMIAIFVILAWQLIISPMQMGVTVSGESLKVKNSIFSGAFTIEKREVEEIFIVDWKENDEFYPKKIVGAAMGDYKTGKFKLKNGWDAKLMTVDSKVLAIKLLDNYVLLAPKNFDDFVMTVNDRFLPIQNLN